MTGMDDLVVWLMRQLDDDERIAQEADRPDVYWYMDGHSAEALTHIVPSHG